MFDLDRWKEIWETIARNRKRSIMKTAPYEPIPAPL